MECELPEPEDEEPKKKRESSKHGGDADAEYLKTLVECEHQAIDQFDKTVLTLTSGAFAVSFAFLKDIVKPEIVTHKGWLISAWASWCVTLTLNLTGFYCSHLAMRHAQRAFRKGIRNEKKLKGRFGLATEWLNLSSGVLFIIGLISMTIFVTHNLSYESNPSTAPTTSITTTNTSTAATAPSTSGTNASTPQHPGAP